MFLVQAPSNSFAVILGIQSLVGKTSAEYDYAILQINTVQSPSSPRQKQILSDLRISWYVLRRFIQRHVHIRYNIKMNSGVWMCHHLFKADIRRQPLGHFACER